MNIDLILAIVFYLFIYLFYLKYKHKFEVQGKVFVLYKTKLGLKLMDKIAKKCSGLLKFLKYIAFPIGYLGMFTMVWLLIKGALDLVLKPDAIPMLAPVLPGIQVAPNIPILSFWHWIITILIVATIHEFSHGIYARLANIKIKSSGFAFLGPILAAFVEPDEKQMMSKSKSKQIAVLVAGPFSNILTGIIFLIITILVVSPLTGLVVENQGVEIVEMNKGMPILDSDVELGEIVTNIDGNEIKSLNDFVLILDTKDPGDIVEVNGNEVELADNGKGNAILGVSVKQNTVDTNWFFGPILRWTSLLFFWLFVISLGVGLFNLLPLGPVDGGRMFLLGSMYFIKDEKKAMRLFKAMSFFILALIVFNLMPFIMKFFSWIFGLVVLLF